MVVAEVLLKRIPAQRKMLTMQHWPAEVAGAA